MTEVLLRRGEWDVVDPSSASWRYLSFRVERLRDGEHVSRRTGGEEIALVPLGVDRRLFGPPHSSSDREAARSALGIPAHAIVVG